MPMLLVANPLNSSPLIFPVIECFHIAGFVMAIGTCALVDFRMLNLAMAHQTPAQLTKDTSPWTVAGLILVICSGLLIYSTDPDMYYLNLPFLLKMGFLILAIVFHYTVLRKLASSNAPPGKSKLAACVSLALWVAVVFGGIFIGFTSPNLSF
jgi:hypothetical protein